MIIRYDNAYTDSRCAANDSGFASCKLKYTQEEEIKAFSLAIHIGL